MARLTRRDLLHAACGGYALLASALLAACGNGELRPTKGAGRPVGAAPLAASPTTSLSPTVSSSQPYITYPPLPTIDATVILPTVVLPPNHETVTPKPTIANVPTRIPSPTHRPEDPHCYTVREERIAQPDSYTRISTLVVIATITTIHPSRWSTPDGQRPPNPWDPQSSVGIYTLVEAQVEQTLKGTAPASVSIQIPYGTVGADCALAPDSTANFTNTGERVVLFLMSPPPLEPKQLNGVTLWWLHERYTITSAGQATNKYQTLPLSELAAIVTAAAGTPSSPSPVPSGTPAPTGTP